MHVRRRPSDGTTPDNVVLRHVRRNQHITTAFTVVLPVIGLVTSSGPDAAYIVALAALLAVFVVLHVLAIGLVAEPPLGRWRTALIWALVLVSISAASLASFGTSQAWPWLILPGTAAADLVALRPRANTATRGLSIALTMAGCVYLVVWPELGPNQAWQQSLLAFAVVMFIGYWESNGPLLWQRTVDAEKTALRLAVTKERLRMSEDLHDILGRALEVVAFKSELASRLLRQAPERAEQELDQVQHVARRAVEDVRALVRTRQAADAAQEIAAARRLLESASIRIDVQGEFGGLPGELADPLGRVIREGVTNMLRHAHATVCEIRLTREADAVELAIRNNGVTESPATGSGTGLANLRRHIAERSGELTTEPRGTSFTLRARLPLSD